MPVSLRPTALPGSAAAHAHGRALADAPIPRRMHGGGEHERAAESSTPADDKAVRNFHAFALNFLLLPLLDDAGPSRWADPTVSLSCDDADVRVDGAPPRLGAPVPNRPFTVQWRLLRCSPMQGPVAYSGSVALQVVPGPTGYTARVLPEALRIATAEGVHTLHDPFTARLEGTP